jgi:hypothetical protein
VQSVAELRGCPAEAVNSGIIHLSNPQLRKNSFPFLKMRSALDDTEHLHRWILRLEENAWVKNLKYLFVWGEAREHVTHRKPRIDLPQHLQ